MRLSEIFYVKTESEQLGRKNTDAINNIPYECVHWINLKSGSAEAPDAYYGDFGCSGPLDAHCGLSHRKGHRYR